ncbi:MAG: sigma-54-dependent Fis family transcriptional regulator [Bryobacterales bacterium]|nr:sigma-54-dependent Fis family transcriptional regulator [Bryobacterales bacterium]
MRPDQHEFLGMKAVFRSEAMRNVLARLQRFAQSNATVLIEGESGTGKEILARAVHHFSLRPTQPWVDVSCAALPEHLVESELFGYEKGAFSGAQARKEGLFELAHGGTLFLDEIGELDARMQVKLLRILDCGSYYRLGGTRKVEVNVRVVAATNRDLEKSVAAGEFRKDLYHRLAQLRISAPPLRERKDDILPLADFFLGQYSMKSGFSFEAERCLEAYNWPGNVRELRNVVMSSAVISEGPVVEASALPAAIHDAGEERQRRAFAMAGDLSSLSAYAAGAIESSERQLILRVLGETHGHQEMAARILGISARTLSRRLKSYQLSEKAS